MFGMRTPIKKTTTRPGQSPTKDSTNARKSFDKWETETDKTTTPPVETTPPAGPSGSTLRLTFAKPTATRRPSMEGAEASKTYTSRSAEATACLLSAKAHMKGSRNLKTEIREAVEKALTRLTQLVREAETDPKTGTTKTKTRLVTMATGTQTETRTTMTGTQTETRRKTKTMDTQTDEDQTTLPTPPPQGLSGLAQQMSEHSQLLLSTQKQMEELKAVIKDHQKTVAEFEAPSYARVAATGCSGSTPVKRDTLHSVVVASTVETETTDQVLDKLRKVVDAKEGWVKVERVRRAKNRKVIMGFSTTEERDRATDRIRRQGTDLTVENVKNRDPLLIFRDVLLKNSDADVLKALRNQNREVFRDLCEEDQRLEIRYRRRARNPHNGHVVLSTSPLVWQRLTARGYAHIDLQRVRVDDQSPLVQCTRCLAFGHGRKHCTEDQDSCSHCRGHHVRADCPEWGAGKPAVCINCYDMEGDHYSAHNAFSNDCIMRKKWDKIARSTVAYC